MRREGTGWAVRTVRAIRMHATSATGSLINVTTKDWRGTAWSIAHPTSASWPFVNVTSKHRPRTTRHTMHSSSATGSLVDVSSEHRALWSILHTAPTTRSVVDVLQNRAWSIEGV